MVKNTVVVLLISLGAFFLGSRLSLQRQSETTVPTSPALSCLDWNDQHLFHYSDAQHGYYFEMPAQWGGVRVNDLQSVGGSLSELGFTHALMTSCGTAGTSEQVSLRILAYPKGGKIDGKVPRERYSNMQDDVMIGGITGKQNRSENSRDIFAVVSSEKYTFEIRMSGALGGDEELRTKFLSSFLFDSE